MKTTLKLQELESRIAPAVSARFSAGLLHATGDNRDNELRFSVTPAGDIQLNGKSINGRPTIGNTERISVLARDGDDIIDIGGLTGWNGTSNLDGGAGNDRITASSGHDVLWGGVGNDTLDGGQGNDDLIGSGGDDELIGGGDNDYLIGDDGALGTPLAADVNRDGRMDLVFTTVDAYRGLVVTTRLAGANDTWRTVVAIPGDSGLVGPLVADVNRDRRDDLVFHRYDPTNGLIFHTKLSNGDGTWTAKEQVLGDATGLIGPVVADVNRDRRDDLVFHRYDPANGLVVRTKLSNGDGTWTAKEQVLGDGGLIGPVVADVNRDRRDDLVFHWFHPTNGLVVRTKLSNGDGTWTAKEQVLGDATGLIGPVVADVNRDRRADLVFHRYDPMNGLIVLTKLSKGDGTWTAKEQVLGDATGLIGPVVADVNRDRRDDLVFHWYHPTNGLFVHTKLSKGDGTWANKVELFGYASGLIGPVVADVNRDRRDDLVFVAEDGNEPGVTMWPLLALNSTWAPREFVFRAGNDQVDGGTGDDAVSGDGGNDFAHGGEGNDLVNGGAGNDDVRGDAGNDTLHGNYGDDLVTDYYDPAGHNELFGDSGNDLVEGGQGNDGAYGGPGNDQVNGYGGNDDVRGDSGNDTLHGNDGDDLVTDYYDQTGSNELFGDYGNDLVEGGQGNDGAYGGPGNDLVSGYGGNDDVRGYDGNDTLHGNDGDDLVTDYYDQVGSNQLFGDSGNDLVEGGQGNDGAYGGQGDDQVNGYGGNDDVRGDAGNDTLHGNDGDDLVTDYYDQSGHNSLFGDAGNDQVEGGQGNDQLFGGSGTDSLYGYDGLDGLFGGVGDLGDYLNGGGSADRYLVPTIVFLNEDTVVSESSDAIIWFATGNKSWTNEEIEQIDDGLKLLHERTRNTQLLRLANSNGFVLYRNDDLGGALANNNSEGTIRVADIAFTQDPDYDTPGSIVIHEIGHNWDEPDENARVPGFRALNTGNYLGEDWEYQWQEGFVSAYAQKSSLEDFAETLTAQFFANSRYDPSRAPDKVTYINSWLDALTT